ncbi:MAG: T9SS type A sorting domain-containing protein [Flaviramulus sp.]|nr:T9SS type A sorting domain-containing protein [Flaviramulus sp.]
MKTKLLLLVAFISSSQMFNAQSITFTSTLTEAQIGTTITVNYEYTIPADGNIYCAINLYNDFTWSAMVADGSLSPAPAGTNVAGSFDFTIPPGTTQTVDLTSPDNYKLVIELSDAGWNWLAGDYPATQINLQNAALSIKNSEFLEDVSMFYSNNRIHVKGLNTSDKYELKIFNLFGQEVKSITKDNNVVNLASAIYIAKLEVDGKGIKTSKVLIN